MKGFYKSYREYERIKNISYKKIKNKIVKKELIETEIKGKRIIIDVKELLKYLIQYL